MKKVYSKPEIFFESFSLSQNIASDCEVKPGDSILEFTGAGAGLGGGSVGYAFSATNCDVDVTNGGGDGEYNGVCYHVFSNNGTVNVFNS